jgi:hypothetical protein
MTKTAIMAENKLILLYLIYQLDMPISWADLLDIGLGLKFIFIIIHNTFLPCEC